jgi:tetratricopeptide (TPR) repeat protein
MNRPAQALVLLSVVCALVVPSSGRAASPAATPVLLAQDASQAGGDQGEMSKAKGYYRHGVELMNNLKYLDAVEQFQLAIDEDPKYVDAFRRLALAYTEMAKSDADYYQDALDTYQDLEGLLPADDVDVRKNIAYVQAAMGDLDDAIATYQQILTITPKDCAIWSQIGSAEKLLADRAKGAGTDDTASTSASASASPDAQKHMTAAVDAYTKVTELCPDDLGALNTLGEIYFSANEPDKAAGVYEKMMEQDPKNLDVASKLAYLYYKAEDWKDAAPAYKRLLDIDSTRVNDRAIYAKVLQKLDRCDDAARQYELIIQSDPAKKTLYCNLGFLYALDCKDGEKAVSTAMRGIAENAPVQGCLYAVWGKGLELRADDQLRNRDYDRSVSTYGEAKIKFQSILSDKDFGDYGRKEIQRLDQLIERAKQMKAKEQQEN